MKQVIDGLSTAILVMWSFGVATTMLYLALGDNSIPWWMRLAFLLGYFSLAWVATWSSWLAGGGEVQRKNKKATDTRIVDTSRHAA